MNITILHIIFIAPLLGVVAIFLSSKEEKDRIRTISAISTGVALVLSILLLFLYNQSEGGVQFLTRTSVNQDFGISLIFGVDGINIPMLILTSVVGLAGVFSMWRLEERVKEFYALFLLLLTGVIGAFLSFDLFFFFLFFELAVLPMYLLITMWGSKNKDYAAMKLTIYLLGSSCFVITAFLMLYHTAGLGSFDFLKMMEVGTFTPEFQKVVFPMLFVGFGVLAAIFPFHTWSPDGYAAAPTAASMVHAGVLKQLGAYGVLRLGIGICPEGASAWAFLVAFIAVCNILYAAMIAVKQKDLKYLIGYSSVAHMGVVMLGLSTVSTLGYTGAVFQMFAHGMVTALLFSCIGYIYDTTKIRIMDQLGGLAKQFPLIAFAFCIAGLANVGMPGLAGFPAEIQVFFAAVRHIPLFGVLGIFGIMLSTIYIFRAMQKTLFGPMPEVYAQYKDATLLLAFPRYLLVAFLIFFGFFPQILVNLIRTATESMVSFN